MPFTIIAENCTGCSACEKRCPTRAISGDPKKAYFIEDTLCIDCGACVPAQTSLPRGSSSSRH
jgi:ferredoxin